MSNRLLEEQEERRQTKSVADALGISVDDLDQLEWRIEENMSEDGVLYGHDIYFEEGSDDDVLAKLGTAVGEFIRVGPLN